MSEPTPVPAAAEATPDFAAFEAQENRRALGEPEPEPAAPTPPADPDADDQDEEPVAEAVPVVEAKPEPTPEKPVSKRQQHINDLERKAKLAEIRAEELAAKIAALEAKNAPAAEPKPTPAAVADTTDPKPTEAEFDSYADFVDARSRWNYRQAKREDEAKATEAKAAEHEAARTKDIQTRMSTWVERRDAFAAKTPDYYDKTGAFLDSLMAGTPIGDALMDSDVGPQVALYLATHPEEAERIARLAPISALRALGKLEAQFDSSLTSASASAGPAAKTVTTAPAPPTTLSARSAHPADPVAAAVARGDFSAFEAEENRKAIAASR